MTNPVTGTCRALILSPIDAPVALSAGLSMVGSAAPVLQTSNGSAVFLEIPQQELSEDDELMVLLGEDRPIPDEVSRMAALVSKMAGGGAVALTSWTSDGSEGVSGTITARRFVNGEPEEKLPAGIVLATMDAETEDVLLGRLSPEEAGAERSRKGWTGFLRGPGFRP